MSRYSVSPELLFDRPWRVGHPFRPHCGRVRRWCITLLLILFCLVIGGYDYLTDSVRVRSMAQAYLSRLIGGRVEVGGARLSIFEGLRLEHVAVHVDDDEGAPDSVIFSAQTFVIRYDPRSMLTGQLEATQIVAEKPRVLLAENVSDGTWNYTRLIRNRNRRPHPIVPPHQKATPLPEILLRNARLDMSEVRDGRMVARGFMAIDGQISPAADADHYSFELQSRGTDGIGPFINGSVDSAGGGVDAHLRNFQFGNDSGFGHDVLGMLPAAVREWWQRHDLTGRLDIPVLRYQGSRDGAPARFRVETDLNGVTLSVGPEEWGGKGAPGAATQRLTIAAPPRPPAVPIRLRQVAGVLAFTEAGIDVSDVSGRIENNAFNVSGRIDGYGPAAPVKLHLSSLPSENVYIPVSPRYISSLPGPVRDFYENLKPEGTCSVDVELERKEPGRRPTVRGEIDVINGQFALGRFPYPLREAAGRILFGPEGARQDELVRIVGLRGRGVAGGPNADSYVTIDGVIGPIAPDSKTPPQVDVRVAGVGISSEPALREAFPRDVQRALRMLGANGEDYPRYHGDFACLVHHPAGKHEHWTFDTNVDLDDAAGALESFPYPLVHVSGSIKVRDGFLDLERVRATQGEASVAVEGRVAWGTDEDDEDKLLGPRPADAPKPPASRPAPPAAPLQTKLSVRIRRLPVDGKLLAALPPERRQWLAELGVRGQIDIDGVVSQPPVGRTPGAARPAAGLPPEVNYDLAIRMAGGELRPPGRGLVVSEAGGTFQLTPDRMHIVAAHGKRGSAELSVTGDVTWPGGEPLLALQGKAVGLELDRGLRDALPQAAQEGWDALRPRGTLDAEISYQSPLGPARDADPLAAGSIPSLAVAAAAPAPLAPASVPVLPLAPPPAAPSPQAGDFHVVLKPRAMSVFPRAMPYLFDGVKGILTVDGSHVILTDLTAHHGDATFALAGSAQLGPHPSYEVEASTKSLVIDDAFSRSLPQALKTIVEGLKLHGGCDLRFPKLVYRTEGDLPAARANTPADAGAAQSPQTPPGEPGNPDIELSTIITMNGAGMDVGVPLEEITGEVRIDAEMRNARLASIHGKIDVARLAMAGRILHHFKADLIHIPDRNELQLARMRAELAGGELAGVASLAFPDDGPSRYALNLVVRNADVRELAKEPDPTVRGDLTASLSLEGAWGDAASRRGRGDVLVSGKEMYHIPLVLGLLQVTNLALPIAEPFQHGAARYSLDGERVNFDQVELRSDNMVMSGSGHLDFDTKKVRMSFTTDNPSGLNVPILRDLWQGARNELLKINIKGTITQPKVETSVMGTFTTTVDEVLRGDSKKQQ